MTTEYDQLADLYEYQYGRTTFDLDFYVSEAQAAEPRVLELACGTGRVTLPIAQAGVPIVGVDSSGKMLDQAREKAQAARDAEGAALPVRFVQADMRSFRLQEQFGLAIIPARSFMHLLDPADQVAALTNIHDHLKPGGKLVLNLFVPDLGIITQHTTSTAQALKHLADLDTDRGRIAVWESRSYDVYRQRIHQTYRYEQLDEQGAVLKAWYRTLTGCYIWPREMEHLLVRCGYRIEAAYRWFDRRPLDGESTAQIWVGGRGG